MGVSQSNLVKFAKNAMKHGKKAHPQLDHDTRGLQLIVDSADYRDEQKNCSLVNKNLCISGLDVARSDASPRLFPSNVTHIVNCCAESESNNYDHYTAPLSEYHANGKTNIQSILKLPCTDSRRFCMLPYWFTAYSYISKILAENKDALILVHCMAGMSRSVSTVVAYLLLSGQCQDAAEAMTQVCKARCVNPNESFIKELVVLAQWIKDESPLIDQFKREFVDHPCVDADPNPPVRQRRHFRGRAQEHDDDEWETDTDSESDDNANNDDDGAASVAEQREDFSECMTSMSELREVLQLESTERDWCCIQ
jgi:protein-tyrosine phosphatase